MSHVVQWSITVATVAKTLFAHYAPPSATNEEWTDSLIN